MVDSERLKLVIRHQGLSNCSLCTTPLEITANPISEKLLRAAP
jgi:hypothetical protein